MLVYSVKEEKTLYTFAICASMEIALRVLESYKNECPHTKFIITIDFVYEDW